MYAVELMATYTLVFLYSRGIGPDDSHLLTHSDLCCSMQFTVFRIPLIL